MAAWQHLLRHCANPYSMIGCCRADAMQQGTDMIPLMLEEGATRSLSCCCHADVMFGA
jgi:hypothetical protein